MTVHCRPPLLFAAALLLPSCIHTDTTAYPPAQPDQTAKPTSTQTTDPVRKTQFAELPSRPGVVLLTKPNAKEAVAPAPVDRTSDAVQVAAEDPKELPFVGPTESNPVPESPLMGAVRAYLGGRPDLAIDLLSSFKKPNQELVLALLPALERSAALDVNGDPTATAMLAEQLRSAVASIEARAALRIEAALLCKSVDGFGKYDPQPKGMPFLTNDSAPLYVEVRNLVSQPTVGPHGETFMTRARVTVEVRDAHGKLVDQPSLEDRRRLSPVIQYEKKVFTRSAVHDFYILYGIPVPPAPGVYSVSLKVQDPVTGRVVKTDPLEFTVAGP